GMAREPSETPRQLARRLTEQYEFGSGPAAAVTSIASAVERVLYAREPGRIPPLGGDLREVRKAQAETLSRPRRVRAVLLPPSTMRRLRNLGEGLLDGFDRLENIRLRRTAQKGARAHDGRCGRLPGGGRPHLRFRGMSFPGESDQRSA